MTGSWLRVAATAACAVVGAAVALGSVAAQAATVLSGSNFTEAWLGSSWQLLPGTLHDLEGVSCTSRLSCIAVGQALQHPLDGLWNGARWLTR